MAFLTLSTYGAVPVDLDAGSAELTPVEVGARERAWNGDLHSSVQTQLRKWLVRLKRVPRADGAVLINALRSADPITCSGDLIDPVAGTALCDAELTRVTHPKHADGEYQLIEFVLHETEEPDPLLLFSFDADAPGEFVFTRTGTATYVDSGGVLQVAAENEPRYDWWDLDGDGELETETLLVECLPSENLVLQSEDLSTTWVDIGTPTLGTPHTASGVSLDLLEGNDAAAAEGQSQTITFTGNGVKAVSVHWKFDASDASNFGSDIVLIDTTSGDEKLRARVTDNSGVPSVELPEVGGIARGVYLTYRPLADGVYRLFFQTDSVTAANTNSLRLYAGRVDTVTDVHSVYWGGIQAEDARYPSSYMPTTTATVTRNQEKWKAAFPHVPQSMTMYVKGIELTAPAWALESAISEHILHVGDDTDFGTPRAGIIRIAGSDRYSARHHNGTVDRTDEVDANPAFGDVVEISGTLSATVAVETSVAIDEGTPVVGTESAAAAFADAWNDQWIVLGSPFTGGRGNFAYISVKVARGEWDIDPSMRKFAHARPHAAA